MNTRPDATPDPMWERVVDDHRPRRRELEAAEAQLRGTTAPRLPPDAIAAIVARAVAPATVAPAARPRQRLVAAGVMAMLCLTSLAWVGARVIWPEHAASSLTLRYVDAVRNAIAATNEADRASAVSVIDDNCVTACRALRTLSTCDDAAIADFAATARSELATQLAGGTEATLRDDVDLFAQVHSAEDRSLDAPARIAAMSTLVRAAAPGLVAMRLARLDAQNDRYRTDMIGRLERTLQ